MKTPWSGMMRLALGLGVTPAAFWALSLQEWRVLTERSGGPEPMNRQAFERLAEGWPDD